MRRWQGRGARGKLFRRQSRLRCRFHLAGQSSVPAKRLNLSRQRPRESEKQIVRRYGDGRRKEGSLDELGWGT